MKAGASVYRRLKSTDRILLCRTFSLIVSDKFLV